MMKYILQKLNDQVYSCLLDDAGHAVEIHADDPAQGPKIGDIYIGLVQKVVKNINAAFVEVIPGVNGYLPFDEIVEPVYTVKGASSDIQAGDQVVVQITRDAFGQKDMSLTTKITLKGRYVVLTSGGVGLGVSKKIPEERRKDLKDQILTSEEFGRLQKRIGPCGIVVRTSAGGAEESGSGNAEPGTVFLRNEVLREISTLEAEMADLKLKAPYRAVHTNLKKQPPRWLSRVLQLSPHEVEEVITDDMSLYRQILKAQGAEAALSREKDQGTVRWGMSLSEMRREDETSQSGKTRNEKLPSAGIQEINEGISGPAKLPGVRLYTDDMVSMEKVYSLERELNRALGKKVDLKSGADLVIESTEALHIIDVNSGRSSSKKSKEEALLAVNLEAAREAARQIRLRNLSGIIVIDFINLKQHKNSLRILEELRRAVFSDPVRTQVVDMTKLGLVEMTRQKIELPLRDQIRKTERVEQD